MKRFIFILIFISFSSNAFPQWLVDGGNLIWPYGNAKLSNGMLHSIKTTTGEIKDWYSGTPIQPILSEHIVQYDTNRVGFAYGGFFNIIPQLTDDAYVDGNTNFWGERLSAIMGQFTINDACSVDISLASGISTYFNSWNYKHTLTNYSAFISDGYAGLQDSALVTNFYGYTSRLPIDLNVTNYYGFYSREMFTSSYTPTLFYHFYGEGDHPSYFGGDIFSSGDSLSLANGLITIGSGNFSLNTFSPIVLGDVDYGNNETRLVVDDNNLKISLSASEIDLSASQSLVFPFYTESVSSPPTKLELDGALGSIHPSGSVFFVDDSNSDSTYVVIYDGSTNWYTSLMSKAP